MTPETIRIRDVLTANRYRFVNEKDLQEGIADTLTAAGIKHWREKRLTDGEVIDFLCDGGIGLEVKIKGSSSEVTRQLQRYAAHPDVKSLLLVTTRWQLGGVPHELQGKPVFVALLAGGLL